MTIHQLHAKFNQAIHWNGILYTSYKLLSTGISFFLFYRLSAEAFSTWATIQAIVFLILLWLDCGLRKSLPRYAPLYAASNQHGQFIKIILIFQITLVLCAAPLLLGGLYYFFHHALGLEHSYLYLGVAGLLFVAEGAINIMALLYYSYFRHKEFNTIWSIILLGQAVATVGLLAITNNAQYLVAGSLLIRAAGGIILVMLTARDLETVDYEYAGNQEAPPYKEFIYHSFIMWINTFLKSLSERNFIMPLITATLGPEPANIFKVANDGALFFQRTILKTIGTADTSLLTHSQLKGVEHELPFLFRKLMAKVGALCIPLSGIFGCVLFIGYYQGNNQYVFHIFIILTLGYLLESLLMPFERVLEVTRRYMDLWLAYIPYIFILFYLYYSPTLSLIGLTRFILLLYGVRLVSVLMMAVTALGRYPLSIPFQFLFRRSVEVFILCSCFIGIYVVSSPYFSRVVEKFSTIMPLTSYVSK